MAVGEPDVVVGFAFLEVDVFGREGGSEVVEGFLEETGEEEQGRSSVEALGVAECQREPVVYFKGLCDGDRLMDARSLRDGVRSIYRR